MKLFVLMRVREATAFAEAGGQALHLSGRHRVPGKVNPVSCAHLIDRDAERLVDTARRLGVRQVKIGRPFGRLTALSKAEGLHGPGQHIDLWGGPLASALAECAAPLPKQMSLFAGGDRR